MKSILCSSLLAICTAVSFGQWEQVEMNVDNHLLGVSAPSENDVFICGGNGFLAKSPDNGDSWQIQSSGTGEDLYSIYFSTPTNGYAVGNAGVFLKTTNGGESWTKTIISEEHLRDVLFLDENVGFIGANHGIILRSADGGNSWSAINTGLPLGIYDIHFSDKAHGCAVGYYGEILVTTDAGVTWINTGDISPSIMIALHQLNSGVTFAIGDGGVVMKSISGYENWENIETPNEKFYSGIDFQNEQTGYIVGGDIQQNAGYVLTSNDGGNTWEETITGTSRLYRIDFSPQNLSGYIVGLDGTFLRMITATQMETEVAVTPISLTLYPTPAVHWIKVKSPEFKSAVWKSYQVFDSIGNTLLTKEFSAVEEVEIDIRTLRAGEYKVLLTHMDGRKSTTSFVKY